MQLCFVRCSTRERPRAALAGGGGLGGSITQGLGPLTQWDQGLEQRLTSTGTRLGAEQGPATPQGMQRTPPRHRPCMGFPHTHHATNPSPLVVTPRCHLEVEKREVSLKRRGGIPWEAMEPALQGPHSQHWGEPCTPKAPQGLLCAPLPWAPRFLGLLRQLPRSASPHGAGRHP